MYQKGKTVRSPRMSLVFTKNTRGYTRFAVVVSKKVLKSAVGRNRIRRRVYEVIRLNIKSIPKGMDYLFVVYSKELKELPMKELEKTMGELVAESRVCYNKNNG